MLKPTEKKLPAKPATRIWRDCVAKGLAWLEDLDATCGRGAVAFAEAWALTLDPRWKRAAEAAVARGASALERRLVRFCGIRVEIPEGAPRGADALACFHRILAGQVAAQGVQVDVAPDLPAVWGNRSRLL